MKPKAQPKTPNVK